MACRVFDPQLPHETAEAQTIWLRRWTSNLLNSACVQDMCANMCLPGHSPLSAGCMTCLARESCTGTLKCLQCLGRDPQTLTQFEPVYACTVPAVAPVTVMGIVLGVVFGVLVLCTLVYTLLALTRRLPVRWQLAADRMHGFTPEGFQTRPPTTET